MVLPGNGVNDLSEQSFHWGEQEGDGGGTGVIRVQTVEGLGYPWTGWDAGGIRVGWFSYLSPIYHHPLLAESNTPLKSLPSLILHTLSAANIRMINLNNQGWCVISSVVIVITLTLADLAHMCAR